MRTPEAGLSAVQSWRGKNLDIYNKCCEQSQISKLYF